MCLAAACAPHAFRLPSGPFQPIEGGAELFDAVTRRCEAVRTLRAEMAVTGRVLGERVRGRLLAGLERGGHLRLEGVAPFGAPLFIVVARAEQATLLLPRERRVLEGTSAADLLEALAGIRLTGDEFFDLLTGCFGRGLAVRGARAAGREWAVVDFDEGGVAYLRRQTAIWQLLAGMRRALAVEYTRTAGLLPSTVRCRVEAGSESTDLRFGLGDADTNVPLDPAAFSVVLPADAVPLTLEELRRSGLLGWRRQAGN